MTSISFLRKQFDGLGFEGAIFDMDGTLLDSLGAWREVAPASFSRRGLLYDEKALAFLNPLTNLEAATYLCAHFPLGITPQQLCQEWTEFIENAYRSTPPKPGIPALLDHLQKRNIPMAVATLTDHSLSEPALHHSGLFDRFACLLTAEDSGGIGKDRPDLFLLAAEKLGLSPSSCIVFEDSLLALKTAKAAGFITCGIYDSCNEETQEEIRALCDCYVTDFSKLFPVEP